MKTVKTLATFGRVASIDIDGLPVSYGYDAEGRLSTVSCGGFTVTYAYTPDGLDAGYAVACANGTAITRSVARDPCRREWVTGITNAVNGTAVKAYALTRDPGGRVTARNGESYAYNGRNELAAAVYPNATYAYTYDSIGNSVSASLDNAVTAYTANSLNQYAAILPPGAVVPDEPTYDADGDQKSAKPKPKARGDRDFKATPQEWSEERYPATQRQHYLTAFGGLAFEWDARNRLVYAEGGGIDLYGLYECGYDVQGRLVFKDAPHGGDYLWDGWRMVKKQAWPWGDFGETVEYVWGKDLSGTMDGAGGVGGLLAVRVDGAWHFPLYDHNGNIVAYVDSTGAVSAEYTYDPFGKVTSHTGMDFDFQFSTKFYDPDIGMYYYGYRYYHPALMRWLTTDPLEEDGGLNLYEFCGNNANCYVDFNGLWSHPLWPDKPEVSVTQIPAIMRANGMSVSAKLMERWLTTASSSAMGEDISTVKMDWALSFTRAKTAYDEIFTSQLYATERCKNVIRAKIKALKPAKNIRFCDLSRDVRAVYKDQVTYKVVGSSYRDPIDDMLGALGRFTFQVALSANVKVKPYGYCAIVDEVGVFIRDQYEFSGIQPLGYWNPQTNYVGKNPYRGSLIENGTFQIYRNNTGLGGDFYIYSDVKRTKLEKPIKIRISK